MPTASRCTGDPDVDVDCTGHNPPTFSQLTTEQQDDAVAAAIAEGCVPESMAVCMWLEQPESELLAINGALGRWTA